MYNMHCRFIFIHIITTGGVEIIHYTGIENLILGLQSLILSKQVRCCTNANPGMDCSLRCVLTARADNLN